MHIMHDPNNILNLHEIYFQGGSFIQEELEEVLDDFVAPFLLKPTKLLIITGKGIHSKHFINGKNPLRYYTEKYLEKVGVSWQYADEHHGSYGAIVAQT
jgi:hypothetical protein